jgi:hypothetical protein
MNATRSSQRRECIEQILKVWEEFPDMRLGQLIVNATFPKNIFYKEDIEFVQEIVLFEQKFKEGKFSGF